MDKYNRRCWWSFYCSQLHLKKKRKYCIGIQLLSPVKMNQRSRQGTKIGPIMHFWQKWPFFSWRQYESPSLKIEAETSVNDRFRFHYLPWGGICLHTESSNFCQKCIIMCLIDSAKLCVIYMNELSVIRWNLFPVSYINELCVIRWTLFAFSYINELLVIRWILFPVSFINCLFPVSYINELSVIR